MRLESHWMVAWCHLTPWKEASKKGMLASLPSPHKEIEEGEKTKAGGSGPGGQWAHLSGLVEFFLREG